MERLDSDVKVSQLVVSEHGLEARGQHSSHGTAQPRLARCKPILLSFTYIFLSHHETTCRLEM